MEKLDELRALLKSFERIEGNFVVNGIAVDDLNTPIDNNYIRHRLLAEMRQIILDEIDKTKTSGSTKKTKSRKVMTTQDVYDVIMTVVTAEEGVSVDDFYSSKRDRNIVFARQLTAYYTAKFTNLSTMQIGKLIGKDHSTVIYSIKAIEDLMCVDKAIRNKVENYKTVIKNKLSITDISNED